MIRGSIFNDIMVRQNIFQCFMVRKLKKSLGNTDTEEDGTDPKLSSHRLIGVVINCRHNKSTIPGVRITAHATATGNLTKPNLT
jgi:hypothetical protein